MVKPSILTCFMKSKERFSMFHQWLWCWLWVLHVWQYHVMIISLKCNLSGDFIMKMCLIFSTLFSINWDEHVFSPLFVNVCVIQMDFPRLKHSCIPKINPEEEPRLWRNRMGRPLSLLHIHWKNNWTLSKFHKTTSYRQQRTSGAQKSNPLSSKGGMTKYKR